MSDKSTPVSFSKSGSSASTVNPGPPPRFVVYAVIALGVTAVSALVSALSLYGLKDWLFRSATKANDKLAKAKQVSVSELHHQVDTTVTGQVVATAVLFIALTIMAVSAYRGRYWSRWGVLALWVLSTFTGTLAGFASVLTIGASAPLAFKLPAFIAGVGFIAAVVFTSLRPSLNYFNLTKPERGAARPGRAGMFAPRGGGAPARPGRVSAPAAKSAASPADAGPDRSRSKQRANAEAVAKGAELARTRAKASKSRRTGA